MSNHVDEGANSVRCGGPVQKVVILGGGSAGMLVALALSKHLPGTETVVIRSLSMGVIGVGEGTIATIGRFLHEYLEIDPVEFHREVKPAIKLGIQFQWGSEHPFHYTFSPQFTAGIPRSRGVRYPRGYYCQGDARIADINSALMVEGKVGVKDRMGAPRLVGNFAYHLENHSFVEFLEKAVSRAGVEKIDALVEHVERGPNGVAALVLDSGERVEADLFVDCSGFRSELLGKTLEEPFTSFADALLCDRALVGGWKRTIEPYFAFTTAEAMDHGWSWRIEHDEIINRGYVYSSSFVDDEMAEREFRKKNPELTDVRLLKYRSGVYRRAWVDNVVAVGNAYGFVEPLEATAIGMICAACDHLVNALSAARNGVSEIQRRLFNEIQDANWTQIRDFLAMHYKPNQAMQTPFWEACRNDVSLGEAQFIYDYYRAVGPDFRALSAHLRRDIFGTEGYLAMLVGQQVPYADGQPITAEDKASWGAFREHLRQTAAEGVGMTSYLAAARSGAIDPFPMQPMMAGQK